MEIYSKDPALLFYTKDWIEGTAELSPEEKGVYIDLLAYQHQKGSLPADKERLARLARLDLVTFEKIWENIKSKFELTESGRLVNRKLENVMNDRSAYGYKNRIIGIYGVQIRKLEKSQQIKNELKKHFRIDDFILDNPKESSESISKRINEWLLSRLAILENENEDANEIIINNNINEDNLFEQWWNTYDYKKGKSECGVLWNKLSEDEKKQIIKHTPDYVASTPEKNFRKFPATYLRNQAWNDEVIPSKTNKVGASEDKFARENMPPDLSNKLFYKNRYFFITLQTVEKFLSNYSELTEDILRSEFDRLEDMVR